MNGIGIFPTNVGSTNFLRLNDALRMHPSEGGEDGKIIYTLKAVARLVSSVALPLFTTLGIIYHPIVLTTYFLMGMVSRVIDRPVGGYRPGQHFDLGCMHLFHFAKEGAINGFIPIYLLTYIFFPKQIINLDQRITSALNLEDAQGPTGSTGGTEY